MNFISFQSADELSSYTVLSKNSSLICAQKSLMFNVMNDTVPQYYVKSKYKYSALILNIHVSRRQTCVVFEMEFP